MTNWFKTNAAVVGSWAALIAVSAIVFGASHGTNFAQFGIGLLTASIALLVAMAVFELIWQGALKLIESGHDKQPPPKSVPKHRQRGQ